MDQDLLHEQIDQLAVDSIGEDGTALRTLSAADVRQLATRLEVPERKIDIAALARGVIPLRYLRNQKTYTGADQIRLLNATAAIVGLGGLGGAALEILARAGVGCLRLIDGDRFEEHNLNRQWICTQDHLGELKAEAAGRRAISINASLKAEVHPVFLTEFTARALIEGCDVVLDCLDNIMSRFILEEAAQKESVSMVSAAVAGLTGHVTTIFPNDIGLQSIYGPRTTIPNPKGAETALGCPPQAVAIVAAMQGAQAMSILTGRTDTLLRNQLWVVDLSTHTFEVLSLS